MLTRLVTADWVLPVSAPPIKNGAVLIADGRIAAVGVAAELREKYPGALVEDFGSSAILPGFINCHSHLELTALRGFLDNEEQHFLDWLLKVAGTRSEKMTAEDVELSCLLGAIEGARAGVTCFGDISRMGSASLKALQTVNLRGIVFQETEFSPNETKAETDFAVLKERFLKLEEASGNLITIGLSPHAPYTVNSRLMSMIAEYAVGRRIPVTIHVAESETENDFLLRGSGIFADIWQKNGGKLPEPTFSTVGYLKELGLLEAKPLLAHCVYTNVEDIQTIVETGASIAHCPKSNAKFGHGIAPLEKFLRSGINVGLGSDSVASNNTCDLLEEGRFALLMARVKDGREDFFSPRKILELATLGSAIALGLESKIGSLEPGKQADLCVVSLDHIAQQPIHDVETALVMASGARDVRLTMVAGQAVYRDGRISTVDEKDVKSHVCALAEKISDN
jgi:5-methylthioadenosine/S-adenosylhomocysteine deaminase